MQETQNKERSKKMFNWIKSNKMYVLMGIVVVIAFGIYLFIPLENKELEETSSEWVMSETEEGKNIEVDSDTSDSRKDKEETVWVDIKGAIGRPGVYEVRVGERAVDVIELAGGLLDIADKNQVNLAMKVVDEMVLYIPSIGESDEDMPTMVTLTKQDSTLNLNTASETELQTLPGIGPSKASAIIEYRETIGSFKTIEDLMEISGIGNKTFEKLKEHISVY